LHSRMNWSRSFVRVMDSWGSLDPRMRARYDAVRVDSPPVVSRWLDSRTYVFFGFMEFLFYLVQRW
jgi:hypothetical protein